MENKEFTIYVAIVFGIVLLAIGFVREITKPISPEAYYEMVEQDRVRECEIKLGGTVYEKGCNEWYYSINEDRD